MYGDPERKLNWYSIQNKKHYEHTQLIAIERTKQRLIKPHEKRPDA